MPVTRLAFLLLTVVTLTCRGHLEVTNQNTDELWKQLEQLAENSDKLTDHVLNITRDVTKHAQRLDEFDCPAAYPLHESRLAELESKVRQLVQDKADMSATVSSVRDEVQLLSANNHQLEEKLQSLSAQGDELTVDIRRLKTWQERPCAWDADCGVDLAECFKGSCLCSPGYYYSRNKNICLEMCAYTDLQPTFMKYPKAAIGGYNMESFPSSLEQCLMRCAENPRCRSVDYPSAGGTCYMQPVTALDVHIASQWRKVDKTFDHYQRNCR